MRSYCPVLIGRAEELRVLTSALSAVREGTGGSVFLLGEPGIGKSRLAEECVDAARAAGLRILRGHCGPLGAATPFRPLVEAVSSQLRTGHVPRSPGLHPYRATLGRLFPELRVPGTPAPADLVEVCEALLRLLAAFGEESEGSETGDAGAGTSKADGALLVLEDLHDADRETLAVVEYLVNHLHGVRVLLVATLRSEPGAAADLVGRVTRRRAGTVLELDPLGSAEVADIAARCLAAAGPGGVPAAVAEYVERYGAGNPYLVEELLSDLLDAGLLRATSQGWRTAGKPQVTVPRSIVEAHARRLDRLDSGSRDLLRTAALLGHRFSLPALQTVTGLADPDLFGRVHVAIDAGFVLPDSAAPDWYSFRHALTAEAVRATLLPGEQAALARRAVGALEAADPALPDERCHLAAALSRIAGNPRAAARYYAEAGRRALADGATETAVALLEHAHDNVPPAERAAVDAALIEALIEADHLDRALTLMDTAEYSAGIATGRRIALHSQIAWISAMAGRRPEAAAQLATARRLWAGSGDADGEGDGNGDSDGDSGSELTPPPELLLAEAYCVFLQGDGDAAQRRTEAERFARLAAAEAERRSSPVMVCLASQLSALLAREQGFDVANRILERILAVAEANDLPLWRAEAMVCIAGNDFMSTGSGHLLEQARDISFQTGSVSRGLVMENGLALHAVLAADHERAGEILARCRAGTIQVRGLGDERYPVLVAAMSAAHRGLRAAMDRELAVFAEHDDPSPLVPLKLGLCRAFCALLEEDRSLALAELDALDTWLDANPSPFYLAGRHGLRPLLMTLEGRWTRDRYEQAASGPGARLRWNAQFLHLADAVLLGREGRAEAAAAAVDTAVAAAAPFPMARALGLRLVGEAAVADGWGEPDRWLRTAEEYFHARDVHPVAGRCRALLRQAGVRVAQRRDSSEQIPAVLRERGVTVREYQVFALLPGRPTNKDIARWLVISPRTVEKHVASLIIKAGQADRTNLCAYAAELARGGARQG
ncbi:transcriptional regulator, LuxR family [Catenulispora acidiphila DSM 44928]|uniref:Transcriptional regulator, LuxR family n=1 Tax=Catenulispora acidiphila (strain DSM 44928 / JCM 14897 / NBRC 102108 / NRRL B-24433 / ID139908) TaxID=479433 RepID=C7QC16_CATAD|nr:AAA family ATPase [Catenulispora acidiphila]ACU72635.1 transcriptional regulator, LuxR family [Catenulispora acidiphila DSM 44928]